MPDYLLLSVDNSESMYKSTIEPAYSEADPNFLGWIRDNYPDTQLVEREPYWCGGSCERWVDEINKGIQDIIDGL